MEKESYLYVLGTHPHQKSDYGGTAYRKTYIMADRKVGVEDLKILANKYLNEPFYRLWEPAYEPPKEYVSNMNVERLLQNDRVRVKDWQDTIDKVMASLSDTRFYMLETTEQYCKVFPEQCIFKEMDKQSFCKCLDRQLKVFIENSKKERQETMERQLRELIEKIDKETLLRLLVESSK